MISAYEKLGGIVWIPRMIEKIRLRAAAKLSEDFLGNMGKGFDGRCVRFLGISYDALVERVLQGGSNEDIFAWIAKSGAMPNEERVQVWNEFMTKRGWRDTDAPAGKFQEYKDKYGLGARADILTYFDFYDVDEGRKP